MRLVRGCHEGRLGMQLVLYPVLGANLESSAVLEVVPSA